jgi:DMSO/TMAO reductase YedYZ molybdopterin-dependent catalytic subunit
MYGMVAIDMDRDEDAKKERIVAARMKLRERFLDRMERTPARADDAPGGSGPPNRHGMPRLPPGQYQTEKWPVLDLGIRPQVAREQWTLTLLGACKRPQALSWDDLMAMEQVEDTSDFHCVTAWSRFDVRWRGVRFLDIAALAEPHDDAEHVMCYGYDGYTTNVALEEALKPDVLLVHMADGAPLPLEHGGPVRLITPQLYAWKGSKWLKAIEFMTEDRLGFWEERGYSSTAHPWRNDRYS